MTASVNQRLLVWINSENWQHVGGNGSESCPFANILDRRERGANLFGRGSDLGDSSSSCRRSKAHTFHGAAANRRLSARDQIAARAVGDVSQGGLGIRNE